MGGDALRAQSESATRGTTAACPRCGVAIRFEERLLVGETLRCTGCGEALEVAYPDPPTLIRRGRVEEDGVPAETG